MPMQLWRVRSCGVVGVPCCARYAGAAHSSRRFGASRRANAYVERVVGERRRHHRQLQLHRHLRITRDEARDSGADLVTPEAERRVHAQQPLRALLRAAEQFAEFVHLVEDPARVVKIHVAFGRQHHAPRRAVHERHARAPLHLREPLADGCRGEPEFARGRAQAARRGQRREEAEIGRLDGIRHVAIHELKLKML
jgi:hypothetical protein